MILITLQKWKISYLDNDGKLCVKQNLALGTVSHGHMHKSHGNPSDPGDRQLSSQGFAQITIIKQEKLIYNKRNKETFLFFAKLSKL